MTDFMSVFAAKSQKKHEKLMAALNVNGSIAYYNDLMNQCSFSDAFDFPKLCAMVSHDFLCSYGGRGGILILPIVQINDCYITNLLPKYEFDTLGLAVEANGKRYSLAIIMTNVSKQYRTQLEQFCQTVRERIPSIH